MKKKSRKCYKLLKLLKYCQLQLYARIAILEYLFQFMQTQTVGYTKSKSYKKSQKASSKTLMKHYLSKLHLLPNNQQSMIKIYLDIIQTTYNIGLNIEMNSKLSIDLSEIICNNFILGAKVKYMAMFGGFIFVAQKLVVQGITGALRALQSLKTMTIQDQNSNQHRNQIIMAIYHIKYLLLPTNSEFQLNMQHKFPKLESMIFNAIISFSKIVQQDSVVFSLSKPPLTHNDLQQVFFHQCLKSIQISRLGKRKIISRQIFGSYLRFITRQQMQPKLDLCKVLLDCLRENDSNERNENKNDQREQGLTGFLVRKTFDLICQFEKKQNFYLQEDILKQLIRVCLDSQQVLKDKKNLIQIINTLFSIKKLHLFSHIHYWKQYGKIERKKYTQAEYSSYQYNPNEISNSVTKKKNSPIPNRKEIYFFLVSIYQYVSNIVENYSVKVYDREDDDYFYCQLQEFSIALAENVNQVLKQVGPTVTPLWHYIINSIHGIKTELVSYCQKFSSFDARIQHFLRWSVAIEIQQIIVGNRYFQQITKNNYLKYQFSNIYILLIKSVINDKSQQPIYLQNNFGVKSSYQKVKLREQVFYKIIEQYAEEGILTYWDDLLIFGAKLFGMGQDSVELVRISNFLSNLLKCRSMYFVAHKLSARSPNLEPIKMDKYYRMSGFTNLLVQFLKLNEDSEAGQVGMSSSQTQGQKRRKWKKQKQKIRCDLMVQICNTPVKIIVEQIYPLLENRISEQDRNLPFEQLIGCFITLIPLVHPQVTISQKILFNRTRNHIVNRFSNKSMDKIRYAYHKNLAYLLRQYTTKNNNGDKPAKDENKLRIIYSYIDSYKHLFSKIAQYDQSENQNSQQNNSIKKVSMQKKDGHKISFGNRKAGKNEEEKFDNQAQLNQMHNTMTYVNFIQWIVAYCRKKQLFFIIEFMSNNLEIELQNSGLEENLMFVISQFNHRKRNDYWLCQIQMVGECVSKLVYLKSKRYKSDIIEDTKQREENANERGAQFKKFNIQFQLQQSVIIVHKLNGLIKNFSQICMQSLTLNLEGQYWLDNLLERKWDQSFIDLIKQKIKKWGHVRNFKRFIVVLNNILGVASNLGFEYDMNPGLKPILLIKILVSLIFDTRLETYARFSEMLFLGYFQDQRLKQQEIHEYLAFLQKSPIASKQRQYASLLAGLIGLYMNFSVFSFKKFSDAQSLLQPFHLTKIVLVLQNLEHIHPHKSLISAISGYIYQMRSITESKLIEYKECVLPMTSSLFIYPSSEINSLNRFQNFLQQSSSQLDHFIFAQILSRTMQCLWLNHQLSQFRSSLRLSLMYFIRSNNIKGTLVSLYAHQTRTKLLSIHQKQNDNRKSQIIPVGVNQSKKLKVQFSQLDMLSLTDSFGRILICIYDEKFRKKSFEKFCNLILGTNRRRTSMSFHMKFQSIIGILKQSVEMCGQLGAKIFLILGEYSCKVFENRKQSYVYSQYLQIIQKYLILNKLSSKKEAKQSFDLNLIKTFTLVKEPTKSSIPHLIITKIKQMVRASYYHAQILQNLLEQFILFNEQQSSERILTDQQIVQIAILFIDHNFQYKEMIEGQNPITCKNDETFASLRKSIQVSNQIYFKYINSFEEIHRQKLKHIYSESLPHALSIVYPLANDIYIISASKPLIVTKISRSQFDENVQTIETLIGNSSKILNDTNIDPKEWWKSRERVDRAMGRIVNEIEIWGWDDKVPSELSLQIIKKKEEKLWKLIFLGLKNSVKYEDIKKAYKNSYNQQSDIIDQIYRRTSTFLKKIDGHKESQARSENLIILIHSNYNIFPFESILTLSKSRAVYRIPSFYYFYKHLKKDFSSSYLNTYEVNYLINSANDLDGTQKNFYKIKESFPQWQGIVGRKPTIQQYFQLLDSKLFLFMGHGTGISHFKERQIYRHKINSFLMLFGCCSASLTQDKCEPNGATLSHLINESPGVLGCLWQVTDKDTDKVTEGIFRSIKGKYENLSKVLSNSKKLCKHQYLNGGALIIYGLPAYISHN